MRAREDMAAVTAHETEFGRDGGGSVEIVPAIGGARPGRGV